MARVNKGYTSINKIKDAQPFAYIFFIHFNSCVEKKESEKLTFSFPSANNFSQYSEYIDNRKKNNLTTVRTKEKKNSQSNIILTKKQTLEGYE